MVPHLLHRCRSDHPCHRSHDHARGLHPGRSPGPGTRLSRRAHQIPVGGRFRPYIIFDAPLLAVSFVLAFTSPSAGSTAKVWYAGVAYVVLCFLYGFLNTVVNIPYWAIAGVMTTATGPVLTSTGCARWGRGLSQILLRAVVMPLPLLFSGAGDDENSARGFVPTMGLLAVLAVPLFWVTALRAREVITLTPEQPRVPFGRTVRAVLDNGQLIDRLRLAPYQPRQAVREARSAYHGRLRLRGWGQSPDRPGADRNQRRSQPGPVRPGCCRHYSAAVLQAGPADGGTDHRRPGGASRGRGAG
ncbi:hypothetical protein D5R93_11910 [Actinomyces lilanjuaniae]|uniref:RDD domain-containing protein n=1 Tax=Actinomyces lilanjuaniae TaxID=2321394 RepID=A0ABN5PTC9_9ACTO|nr:hypothetical protein D5R93_11910 [Actinomyces lilanjuaniae]